MPGSPGMSDPSYAGQFVTFTMPEIGNVGVNDEDTFKYHINTELEKDGVASPVGPVARPAEKKEEETFVVPPRMIYIPNSQPSLRNIWELL